MHYYASHSSESSFSSSDGARKPRGGSLDAVGACVLTGREGEGLDLTVGLAAVTGFTALCGVCIVVMVLCLFGMLFLQ